MRMDTMTKQEFDQRLKKLNLKKTSFSKISNMNYGSINNWGTKRGDKDVLPIPPWVEPFLTYYEDSVNLGIIRSKICKDV